MRSRICHWSHLSCTEAKNASQADISKGRKHVHQVHLKQLADALVHKWRWLQAPARATWECLTTLTTASNCCQSKEVVEYCGMSSGCQADVKEYKRLARDFSHTAGARHRHAASVRA